MASTKAVSSSPTPPKQVASAQKELMSAIETRDLVKVSQLLARGVDVNHCDGFYTPLVRAVHCGGTELVEALLQAGANPNQPDAYHRLPLDWALYGGKADLAQLLRDAGADINALSAGRSMLEWALSSFKGNPDPAPERLERRKSLSSWVEASGFYLKRSKANPADILTSAIETHDPGLLQKYLDRAEYEEAVNAFNRIGDTPLLAVYSASMSGLSQSAAFEMTLALLYAGADPAICGTSLGKQNAYVRSAYGKATTLLEAYEKDPGILSNPSALRSLGLDGFEPRPARPRRDPPPPTEPTKPIALPVAADDGPPAPAESAQALHWPDDPFASSWNQAGAPPPAVDTEVPAPAERTSRRAVRKG